MPKLFYYIKLLRPLNLIIAGFSVLVATSILNGFNDTLTIITTILVVVSYTGGANALNDSVDYETDMINSPKRPIPIGIVTKNKALLISFILFLLGTVLCLQLTNSAKFIGIIISMPLMVFYSTHLKGKPLIGNIAVSLVLALSFLFCGAAHQNFHPMWLPSFLAFGLTLLREIVKDIADIKGDLSVGLATFPIVKGIRKTIIFITILSLFIGVFSILPYLNGTYGFWYGLILFIGVEIPLLIIVILLLRRPKIQTANYAAQILKCSTIMGIIAIYTGSKL